MKLEEVLRGFYNPEDPYQNHKLDPLCDFISFQPPTVCGI